MPQRTLELLGYSAHNALRSGGGHLGAVDLLDPVQLINRGRL
jgi:hypothetical protein